MARKTIFDKYLFRIRERDIDQTDVDISGGTISGVTISGSTGATIGEFSTDGTLADNSDAVVPTEKAVKTYADTKYGENDDPTFGTTAFNTLRHKTAFTQPMSDAIEITSTGENYIVVTNQDLTSVINAGMRVWLYCPDEEMIECPAIVSEVEKIGSDTKITFCDNLRYYEYEDYLLKYPIGDEAIGATATGFASIASEDFSTASGYRSIASGYHSIASGHYSTASGVYSTASGYHSIASGQYSTASGVSSTASGYRSIASGQYSTASGVSSTAIGYYSTASGDHSIANGNFPKASIYGQVADASGIFSKLGDAQSTKLILRKSTTNATQTELFADGLSVKYAISEGGIYYCTIKINGTNEAGTVYFSGTRQVVIKNIGGTTSLSGSVQTVGTDITSGDTGGISITANDTNDALCVKVTGKAETTMRWVAVVEAVEIGFY